MIRGSLLYLWYVLRHKWYVLLECAQRGLWWRGLVHDLSKLRPDEFFPYARHFYGPQARQWRDETGYYKPTDTGDPAFDKAWLLHQNRNDHHWQYWVLINDTDEPQTVELEMPSAVVLEMICDWRGAGRAQGHGNDVLPWWNKNGGKMKLHPLSRLRVEQELSKEASCLHSS